MDPLSEILSMLKPGGYGFRSLDAGGDWSLSFEASEGIKCFAVATGTCWLSFEETTGPVRLSDGDFVLLPGGKPFRLSSSSEVPPVDAMGVDAMRADAMRDDAMPGDAMRVDATRFFLAVPPARRRC